MVSKKWVKQKSFAEMIIQKKMSSTGSKVRFIATTFQEWLKLLGWILTLQQSIFVDFDPESLPQPKIHQLDFFQKHFWKLKNTFSAKVPKSFFAIYRRASKKIEKSISCKIDSRGLYKDLWS